MYPEIDNYKKYLIYKVTKMFNQRIIVAFLCARARK